MAERTTKTLTTPSNHTVVIKEYLTAREMLPILKLGTMTPTPAENIDKALKMIEAAVVSIDGATENLPELIQDLPLADYIFLTKEVASLSDFQKAKSEAGTSSSPTGAQS